MRPQSPGLPDGLDISSHPIAAHRDSVLVEIEIGKDYSSWRYNYNDDEFSSDYFIYCAGDAAADPSRPPSLSLLPPCYLTEQEDGGPKKKRYMHDVGIALMRRTQDEVLVAALDFCEEKREEPVEAEVCLLRSGGWQWELKRLPVIHDEGKREEVSSWEIDRVIPVGDRFFV
jgi:hypothetical protein